MTPFLLSFLCDPVDHSELTLQNPSYNEKGMIVSGDLVSAGGRTYPIIKGIPRFVGGEFISTDTVQHFGDQWNHYNFDDYHWCWLNQTVQNTFGTPEVFKDKIFVDCGAGSGMQSRWVLENGAKHVIALDLSHAVDGIISHNLEGFENVDIIQCSIDAPPLKPNGVNGIVMCHNVIQHTPSVEKTAEALWNIVGSEGEFVFNCYIRLEDTWLDRLRFKFYMLFVRNFLSRRSAWVRRVYSHVVSALGLLPILRPLLVKAWVVSYPEVERGKGYLKRLYKGGVLCTFDGIGSHAFQHYKSYAELQQLIQLMQPDASCVKNGENFFTRPQKLQAGIRLFKSSTAANAGVSASQVSAA